MSNFIIFKIMEIINLSEREVSLHLEKSSYKAVEKPLLRRLNCKKDYNLTYFKFQKGTDYLLWIGQCFNPKNKLRQFYHFVALPQLSEKGNAVYHIVPLDVFGEYPKEDLDMVVDVEGEEYKLIKDFNGYAKLIPRWTLDREKMREYIKKELGETPYLICARIMGTNIAPNDIFVGWEILTRGRKYTTVAYFNIFESKLVKNLGTLTYVQPMGNNQKACLMGGSLIKFYKNKIRIKIGQ